MDPAWNIKVDPLICDCFHVDHRFIPHIHPDNHPRAGAFNTRAHTDNTTTFPMHPAYAPNPSLASRQVRQWFEDGSGISGDPVLAAERIYRFATGHSIDGSVDEDVEDERATPMRLQLGDDSWMGIQTTLQKRLEDMKVVEEWSKGLAIKQ